MIAILWLLDSRIRGNDGIGLGAKDPRPKEFLMIGRLNHVAIAVPDLEAFFNQLPNGDRQFVILPGTAHSVTLAINRQLFWHVARAFLTMPAPIAT